jgi:class 3 adenylate cyclase
MANRRARIQDYYLHRQFDLRSLQEKAAAQGRFAFHGPAVVDAVVIRTDLNGYSSWARDRQAADRAAVLDDFFTRLMPSLDAAGGIYFRDEGDCIVALFSSYFGSGWSYASAEAFAMNACSKEYGKPRLTAKSTIACGRIAVYQKAHEVGTEDWSAEGDPFVRAGRLETAIGSKQQLAYFAGDYDLHFVSTNIGTGTGTTTWNIKREKLQVQGLGVAGGWTDVVLVERRQVDPSPAIRTSGVFASVPPRR